MVRSIRGRITLGSLAIAAVVLVALAAVLLGQLRQVAAASVAAMARHDVQTYAADLKNQPGEQPDRPEVGTQVLVVSPQGDAVVDTLPPGLAPAVRRAGAGTTRLQRAGTSYAVSGETVRTGGGAWFVWAVRDTRAAEAATQEFGRVLLLAAPVILLLVGIGSWLLVGAALRPVRRLRAAAEGIRRSGRPGRLPEGGGADELAELTATLNRFLEAQQEALERERRMVADASHELRTPLAVLTTQLELAQRHSGDAEALGAAVTRAQANVGALSRLATQLLELSVLESDGARAEHAPVGELVSELMDAVDRARSMAPEEVRVEFELSGDLDEAATAPLSAIAFGRIADNLATNALHATSAGSVELELRQEATRLVLTVADTGRGLPPEFVEHAFDRFTRSEHSRAAGVPGSGIGLALVRALVDAAGGRVALRNRPHGGAIAEVVLPLGT